MTAGTALMRGMSRPQLRHLTNFTKRSRQLATAASHDTVQASYLYPNLLKKAKSRPDEILKSLAKNSGFVPKHHNSALLLTTADLSQRVVDDEFMTRLVQSIAQPSNGNSHFSLLTAVVDGLSPARGSSQAFAGIALLTSPENVMFNTPSASSNRSHQATSESLASLTFHLGEPSLTLPLARTTFSNQRDSTLVSTTWDISERKQPCLLTKEFQQSHCINITPVLGRRCTWDDLRLWAPVIPLTAPRRISDSFGNIVKGIEIDGVAQPASTELESAVDAAFDHLRSAKSEAGPIGIWALVLPSESTAIPEISTPWSGQGNATEAASAVADALTYTLKNGGKFFKVLSGGGGWGAKKGLLSLDPEESYPGAQVPLEATLGTSEGSIPDDVQSFFQSMQGFAAPGHTIQFFAQPPEHLPLAHPSTGATFGVSGILDQDASLVNDSVGKFTLGHFGPMSSRGLFLQTPSAGSMSGIPGPTKTKLTIPNSLVYTSS